MPYEIKMPQLSQTTDEVKLVRWIVKEGDTVKKGDILCEVETDKTTMDVECIEDGIILQLLVEPESETVADTTIAVLEVEGQPEPHADRRSQADQGSATDRRSVSDRKESVTDRKSVDNRQEAATPAQIRATRLVKNLARKRKIDLHGVVGTGPGGLITRNDLDSHTQDVQEAVPETESETVLSPVQKVVVQNVTKSKREIPHYYLKSTVYMDALKAHREEGKRSDRSPISLDSYFIFASARVLIQYPKLNAYFHHDKIMHASAINIGFAVASGEDLFVPVIKNADRKTLQQIDAEVRHLTEKVKSNTLESADLNDCTFTITNLSAFGIDEFYAVISLRQSGVLAIGRLQKLLHVDRQDRINIRTACTITGSFDHRVINGAQAAGFIRKVKNTIERDLT